MPEQVEESSVRGTFDVPENRFVKAFIEQAIGIIEQICKQAASRGRSFAARIEGDCDRMRTPPGILTLFDAKFRLRRIAEVAPDTQDPDEADVANERCGVFKHADLYKMHTYRDALEAPAVWILYPGDTFRFFKAHGSGTSIYDPSALRLPIEGVGAIPLAPDEPDLDDLQRVLEHLLGR